MLAMEAAGMVTNFIGEQQQQKLADLGAQLDQSAIENQIETSRLQTAQSSYASMVQLRKTLGTQAAIFAARGQQGGAGSALAISQESIHNFGENEQVRRLNQYNREVAFKGRSISSILDQQAYTNKLKQGSDKDTMKFGMDAGSWANNKWGSGAATSGGGMSDWGMTAVS